MVLIPTDNYQKEIIFNTPGIRVGIGFDHNYLNLCYEATENGLIPDDMDFARIESGEIAWYPMRDLSPNPGNPFERLPEGKYYYSKTLT